MKIILTCIIFADLLIVTLGLLTAYNIHPSYTLGQLFDLRQEFTVPTAYSGLKLGFLAALFSIVSLGAKDASVTRVGIVWSLLVLFFALDELGGIHERIATIIDHRFPQSETALKDAPVMLRGFLAESLLAVPAVILALLSRPLFVHARGVRAQFLAGGVIFAGGAFVVDNFAKAFTNSIVFGELLEECLEFAGLTVMIAAAVRLLSLDPVTLTFGGQTQAAKAG